MGLEFTVLGAAATKGSTRSFRHRRTGRIVTLPDNKNLGAWTQAVKWAAREAGAEIRKKPGEVTVCVSFDFLMPATVKHRVNHTVKPDLDKMLRALLDALTGICYEDDAQVTSIIATKAYGPYEQCRISIAP